MPYHFTSIEGVAGRLLCPWFYHSAPGKKINLKRERSNELPLIAPRPIQGNTRSTNAEFNISSKRVIHRENSPCSPMMVFQATSNPSSHEWGCGSCRKLGSNPLADLTTPYPSVKFGIDDKWPKIDTLSTFDNRWRHPYTPQEPSPPEPSIDIQIEPQHEE